VQVLIRGVIPNNLFFVLLAASGLAQAGDPTLSCKLLDPARGQAGGTVSIFGAGFDGYSAEVTFSGLAGNILALTDSRIDVATPAGLSSGPVVVTIGYYDVEEPAPGTIFGSSFETPAANRFEQVNCGDFTLNRPPVLGAVQNAVVEVGQTLEFTVSASDPDGDPVGLAATPTPMPPGAMFSLISGGFKFQPGPGQVGDHEITFLASDGQLTDQATITITVPELTGITSLQGFVLTTDEAPLEGVRLVWGVEDPVETFTGPDGAFLHSAGTGQCLRGRHQHTAIPDSPSAAGCGQC
jgi:hypothetical protein